MIVSLFTPKTYILKQCLQKYKFIIVIFNNGQNVETHFSLLKNLDELLKKIIYGDLSLQINT